MTSLDDFIKRNKFKLRQELSKKPRKFPFNLRNGRIVLAENYFSEASRGLAETIARAGVSASRVVDETASKEGLALDDFVQSINSGGGQGRGLRGRT